MRKEDKRPDRKQVSIVYSGYEKALIEALGLGGIKAPRLGLKKAMDEHLSKDDVKHLAEIIYTENLIESLKIQLKMAENHLEELNENYEEINKKTLIKKDIALFMDNLVKRSIEEHPEINDLTEIYEANFVSIDIKAMEHNLRYKNAIDIYEEYKTIKDAAAEADDILSDDLTENN